MDPKVFNQLQAYIARADFTLAKLLRDLAMSAKNTNFENINQDVNQCHQAIALCIRYPIFSIETHALHKLSGACYDIIRLLWRAQIFQ
jgi:hypothetical protein